MKKHACHRNKTTLGLLLLTGLVASCANSGLPDNGGTTPDTPETQPTPILGSGRTLFQFDDGVIECDTNYQGDPSLVNCYAAMPSSGNGTALLDRMMAVALQVTGYSPDITSHVWQPLDVTTANASTTITNMQISGDETSVVYTLPSQWTGVSGSNYLATLVITRTGSDGNPQQRSVQTTGPLPATAIQP